jgi:hypothetical protein
VIVVPVLAGLIAALFQLALVPAVTSNGWAAPVLPCAVVAAWAASRRPEAATLIALTSALVLGVISVERAGWFLVALLPAVGVAMLLDALVPAARNLPARVARAAAGAAAGTLGYLATLALAGGHVGALVDAGSDVAGAATITALIAAVVVVALSPLRPRAPGPYA